MKRHWLIMVKRTVANSVAAYLMSVALIYLTKNDYETDSPWVTGLWGVALYWAMSIAVGLVTSLGGVLYLWLAQSDDLEDLVLHDLRRLKLPPPSRYQSKNQLYLSELADDPDAECKDRIRAAILSTQLTMTAKHAGFFGGFAWNASADKAVLRYAQEAPERED